MRVLGIDLRCEGRVGGDDGELRPWRYIYVYSIESRLITELRPWHYIYVYSIKSRLIT